jgi:xylulokinase
VADYLLGIDVGTSSCKAGIFDCTGNLMADESESYAVYYPKPGWAEQDPNEWWQGVCAAIRSCIKKADIDKADIAAVGIAGQSWSAIPVDSGGNVLHNTPIWMDTRAKSICQSVAESIGADRIFDVSGNPFQPTYSAPKILWFKENMPEVYRNARYFLQSNSFIAYKLTGEFTQDKSQGYGLHVYDISRGVYDHKLADDMDIDIDKLPDIYECSDVIGRITTQAAMATGLAMGTPVVAGGLDAACGTLGAGVILEGQTQEQGGQAGGMSICLDSPLMHKKLILSNHVAHGKWLLQGGTVGGGGTLNWFLKEFGQKEEQMAQSEGKSAFEIMSEEARSIAPGSEGLIFLPYMSGERSPIWDEKAKGVFFGLGYDKSRAHMIRALMEGVAYSLYHNVKTANECSANIESFQAVGGAAKSAVWAQIKADVTGIPVKVSKSDTATTWGAAILAGVGAGIYKDCEQALEASQASEQNYEPDPEKHKIYERYYSIYLELYDKLKDTMQKI